MSSDPVPMVFVDLETTGALASVDRITEIGIVELDAQGRLTEWSSLVNPQMPIPPFIQGLTGISDAMVADAPTFSELAGEIEARLQGRLFVAHNARFDYGFLRQSLAREQRVFNATVLCTVKLSRRLYPQYAKHSLDALIERHSLAVPARHRALADAQVLAQFWRVLQASMSPAALREAVDELTGRHVWPEQLAPQVLDTLPEAHGVYVMWDQDGQALHVGGGTSVRQRVLAHFAADRKAAPARRHGHLVARIETHAAAGDMGVSLLEARLRHQLAPLHNRGAHGHGAFTWRLVDGASGTLLTLHPAGDLSGRDGERAYGLYGTERDALKTLKDIAENAQLCLRLLGLEPGGTNGPCKAWDKGQCSGACLGHESAEAHAERLQRVLADLRVPAWPHTGPVKVREGAHWHVLDAWRYLGTARSEAEVTSLLQQPMPGFDRHTYKVLAAGLPRWQAVAIA